ncbi:MAG: lysostaphin resistance A-like protein [bacterium]
MLLPLLWEKTIKKTKLREIGFFVPEHYIIESLYALIFICVFYVYYIFFHSRSVNILFLSPHLILYIVAGCFCITGSEEIFYRGIIQRRLTIILNKYWGLLIASIIFAIIGHPNTPLIDNLIWRLPAGIILGYFYLRTGSLFFPICLHCGFNIISA